MNIDPLSIVLSAVPIISFLFAIYLAFKNSKVAKEQIKLAKEAIESSSTKFIGQFPGYNKKIAKTISSANSNLDLFYDVPGYGLVSDHDSAIDIIKEIESKIKKDNNVSVSIAVYTPQMRKKVISEQLGEVSFDNWKNTKSVKPKLITFIKKYTDLKDLSDLTKEKYIEYSLKEHEKIVNINFKGAKITYIDETIPLYFWMIDEEISIFSIPSYTEGISEHGFITKDSALIGALLKMKRRYD